MHDKPIITLKAASTLDGKIATETGNSKWITGPEARLEGHRLRAQNDAILVGINTLLTDNPRLNVRGIPGAISPIRIVLDSLGRTPPGCEFLNADGVLCLVVVGAHCEWERLTHLKQSHVAVLQAPTARPQIDWLLSQLAQYNIGQLLVEGGSQVHASFIRARRADHLVLFLAGKLIGGQNALSWCGDLECLQVSEAPRWKIGSIQMVGDDLMINADFIKDSEGS